MCCAVCGEGVGRESQGISCSHLDCPRSVWAHRHCLGKTAGRPTKVDLARQISTLEQDELPVGWREDQGTSLLQAIAFRGKIGLQLGDGSGHNTDGLFDEQQIEALEAKMAVAASIVPVGIKNTNGEEVTLHIVCTSIEEGQLMFACSRTCQRASQALSSSPPAAPRWVSASPTVETQDSRSEQGLGGMGDLDGLPVRDSIEATMVDQDRLKCLAQPRLTRGAIREKVVSSLGKAPSATHMTDGVQMISLGGGTLGNREHEHFSRPVSSYGELANPQVEQGLTLDSALLTLVLQHQAETILPLLRESGVINLRLLNMMARRKNWQNSSPFNAPGVKTATTHDLGTGGLFGVSLSARGSRYLFRASDLRVVRNSTRFAGPGGSDWFQWRHSSYCYWWEGLGVPV